MYIKFEFMWEMSYLARGCLYSSAIFAWLPFHSRKENSVRI